MSGMGTLPCRVAISTGSLGASRCRCSILGCCDASSSTPGFCSPAPLQVPSPLCCLGTLHCHACPRAHFASPSAAGLHPCLHPSCGAAAPGHGHKAAAQQLMLRGTGGTPSPRTGERGSSEHLWLLPTPCSIPQGCGSTAPTAHKTQEGSKQQLHVHISEGRGEFYCLILAKAPGSDDECPILACPETP